MPVSVSERAVELYTNGRTWSLWLPSACGWRRAASGRRDTCVPVPATREAAYMHAVTAAGVAHAVAMACIRGTLRGCGCDVDKQGFSSMSGTPAAKFRWGGCSADVNYGLDFSRDFVDQRENTQSARSLMNLHNNEAGRRVLEQTIKLQCRCHGASGSCSLKTCWNSLPSFREVAMALKSRYNKAIQVQAFLAGRKRLPTFLRVKRVQGFRKPQPRQLVFLDHSPSYCEASAVIGNMGTDGRTCRRAKGKGRMAHDSCDLLCCGRGYDTREVTVVSRCNCTFYWCCNVRCHNCIHRTEVFTCK
uniref:Protein Wnt n=1 Tax=Eptatretus burgeri TaxID=7764 RepID=A0A8C4QSW1_EPTBU